MPGRRRPTSCAMRGRRAGLLTAAGLNVETLVHAVAAGRGVSAALVGLDARLDLVERR